MDSKLITKRSCFLSYLTIRAIFLWISRGFYFGCRFVEYVKGIFRNDINSIYRLLASVQTLKRKEMSKQAFPNSLEYLTQQIKEHSLTFAHPMLD